MGLRGSRQPPGQVPRARPRRRRAATSAIAIALSEGEHRSAPALTAWTSPRARDPAEGSPAPAPEAPGSARGQAPRRAPRLAVSLERFGLATGSVERKDQLASQSLAKWVRRDQPLQYADRVVVFAELELGVNSLLDDRLPQLLEAPDLACERRLIGEIRESRPPPQRQRGSELFVALARGKRPGLGDQALEAFEVDRPRRGAQDIAPRLGHEDALAEILAQSRNMVLQRRWGVSGSPLAPQVIDQPFCANDLVRLESQEREHGAPL